jgi:signal transduction histidine kinase
MSAEPAAPVYRRSLWGALFRRVDPYLDPVIGVVAAALALASLLSTDHDAVDPRLHAPNVLAAVATVVAAGSLAWRRKRPVVAYAVFVVGALVVSGTFHYIGLLSVLMLLSLYSLTTHARRREALVGLGVGVGCFVGLGLAGVPDLRTRDVLLAVALLVASWAVGDAVRARREQQRDQLRVAEHEAAAAREQASRAVTEERLRIARELHDVVAHSMSLIAVQAGVGAHVIRTNPAAAEESLVVIADASRRALEQTRSLLGLLREQGEEGTRPPTQTIADLASLAEDVGRAGVEVTLTRSGAPREVDPVVALTTYRVVQESLTNVVKHSAACTATVALRMTDDTVDVEVADPGPARPTPGANDSGHGLIGLKERVGLVGGEISSGTVGDGFRVHATLPTHRPHGARP